LKPEGIWDGDPNYKLKVGGLSNANYVTDPISCRSVSRYSLFLNKEPISMKNGQQKSVTLSTAKSELVSGMQGVVCDAYTGIYWITH
jgi:hypothetical protein